jgi:O-antigen/teichoic acid export membrane protein
MFASSFFSNFTAYLYNLYMGRTLGPANYGILAALVSLLSLVSIPTVTFSTAIVKFTATYKARQQLAALSLFFRKLSRLFVFSGAVLFGLFFFLRFPLQEFLHLPSATPLIILGTLFFLNFALTPNNGVLTGLQKFGFLAFSGAVSAFLKLALGVLLVTLGLAVNGAIGAIALSVLAGYLLTFWPLRFLLEKREELSLNVPWRELIFYSAPVFLSTLGLSLLLTTDILLVKRFFPPEQAGLYSALSLVGRVIFYESSAVVAVMFALVAERQAGEREYRHLLHWSLLLVLLASLPVVVFYTLFPRFSMNFFFGSRYLAAAPYLWLFGLFTMLYSLVNVLANFFLSVKRVSAALLPFSFSLLQFSALYLWHDSFLTVVFISLIVTALLLLALMLYYLRYEAFGGRPRLSAREDHR